MWHYYYESQEIDMKTSIILLLLLVLYFNEALSTLAIVPDPDTNINTINLQNLIAKHPIRKIKPQKFIKFKNYAPINNGDKPTARIVNGELGNFNNLNFSVFIIADQQYACGGSIIHAKHILTSAYCVDHGRLFTIYMGDADISSNNIIVKNATEAIKHPGYDAITLANDIALIKLTIPITDYEFTKVSKVRMIAWEPSRISFLGVHVYAVGWGVTLDGGGVNNLLKIVQLRVISHTECTKLYKLQNINELYNLCATSITGNICSGDMGGALLFIEADGKYTLMAVSSSPPQPSCNSPNPSVFTRINPSNYYWLKNWIPDLEIRMTGSNIPHDFLAYHATL